MMVIAGIGSRETPEDIQLEMEKVGTWALYSGHKIYSGHAHGADWAFERGAQSACTVFLPWQGFNSDLSSQAESLVMAEQDKDRLHDIFIRFHPKPQFVKPTMQPLLKRNAYQVLGKSLNNPVNAVLCWTRNGKEDGGTGQAMRIAKFYNVPIINMQHPEFRTCDAVLERIKQLG